MTVSSETVYAELDWTGVETSFAPGFSAFVASQVTVQYRTAAGVVSNLTLNTHFSVTLGAGSPGSVTVLPIALPAAPGELLIRRRTPGLQEIDFSVLASFTGDVHEKLHDLAAMRDAEIRFMVEELTGGAAVIIPPIESGDTDKVLTVTNAATRALDWLSAEDVGQDVLAAALAALAAAEDIIAGSLVDGSVTEPKLDDEAVSTRTIEAAAVTAEKLGPEAVETDKIADSNVTLAKMANLAEALILGREAGSGSGPPVGLTGAQVQTIIGASTNRLPLNYRQIEIAVNSGDANNDTDALAGEARDSSNTLDLLNPSTMTKRLDAAWAAGTNQGGLFSGSKANSTWYHFHMIRKDADGSIDFGYDTSVTAANKPGGYTYCRRIGSVRTDSSGNILPYKQYGDLILWNAPRTDDSGTSEISFTLIALSVPPGLVVMPLLTGFVYQSGAGSMRVSLAPGATSGHAVIVAETRYDADAAFWTVDDGIPTDTSGRINLKREDSTGTISSAAVITRGWRQGAG